MGKYYMSIAGTGSSTIVDGPGPEEEELFEGLSTDYTPAIRNASVKLPDGIRGIHPKHVSQLELIISGVNEHAANRVMIDAVVNEFAIREIKFSMRTGKAKKSGYEVTMKKVHVSGMFVYRNLDTKYTLISKNAELVFKS